MKTKHWINIGFLFFGLLLSQTALDAAKASQPPIDWKDIPFIFFGCTLGCIFVLGMQIIRRDPKYGRIALRFFEPISIYCLGSGIGALILSKTYETLDPSSILFLIIGLSLYIGVLFSSFLYRRRFKLAL